MGEKCIPKDPAALARWMRMADLFRNGCTLPEIATQLGVSKQRVGKCLSVLGISRRDGGKHLRALNAAAQRYERRDVRYRSRHGCSYEDYMRLRGRPTALYSAQKQNAASRGIEWDFNFWEWWQVWEKSGKWKFRGRGQGWVMCRVGDCGPYSPSNVFIAPARLNSSDTERKKSGLPLGVTKGKCRSFSAERLINGKLFRQGGFDNPADAHAQYLRWGGQ